MVLIAAGQTTFVSPLTSCITAGVERDAHGTIASVRLSASTGAGCADFLAALAERFPSGAVHADDAAAAHS